MSAAEIIQQKGFQYVRDCSLCSGNYRIYQKPDNSQIEIYVRKYGDMVKIKKNGNEVAMVKSAQLEQTLINVGIS